MEQAYRVELGAILDDLGGQISLTEEVSLEPMIIGSETFTPVAPAQLSVSLTNTGAGVVVQGTVAVDLKATCVRCLCEFTLHSLGEVEGFYISPSHAKQLPEEQEYELIHDRSIDLMPALLAALTIDLPFAPVHDEGCAGICPKCGADRNVVSCHCADEVADTPFGALRDLLSAQDPH
ncbi:MAG: YceD family protein [Coriobacteriia bacterium]|nr:YceD family protein [Coriobacteriia bacterium]